MGRLPTGRSPSRPPWKRAALLLLPGSLVVLGLGARATAGGAWRAFTRYQTPFAFSNPDPQTAEPLARQVVIVLIDGLGYDASRSMPFLNELRRRGADAECRVGLPSLSLPARAVIASGAWQEVHGQTTNFEPRPLPVEHIFVNAKRKGLVTGLAAGLGPHTMFGPHVDEKVLYPRTEPAGTRSFDRYEEGMRRIGEASRALLAEKRPNLLLIDYVIMDQAGHDWGAASDEYRRAAGLADEQIRSLASEMDLERGVLVVTADHGHTASGGHGGPEPDVIRVPLVMAGAGIRPGAMASAEQVDIAPTVATLLGIGVPASNQGRVLLELLEIDAARRAEVLRILYRQRAGFVSHYVAWVSGTAPAAPLDTAAASEPQLLEGLEALRRAEASAKGGRVDRESRVRLREAMLFVAALLGLFALMPAARLSSSRDLGGSFAAAGAGVALYAALFPVLGLGYSFSAVNKDEWIEPFFRKDMALGAGACLAAVAASSWLRRRRNAQLAFADLALWSWVVAWAFCALFLLKIAAVYWRHGVFMEWRMIDPCWGFGFYLDLLVVMAVGLLSPVMPLGAWLGGRRAPSRR